MKIFKWWLIGLFHFWSSQEINSNPTQFIFKFVLTLGVILCKWSLRKWKNAVVLLCTLQILNLIEFYWILFVCVAVIDVERDDTAINHYNCGTENHGAFHLHLLGCTAETAEAKGSLSLLSRFQNVV